MKNWARFLLAVMVAISSIRASAQHLGGVDLERLTQEANELASLAQSIPPDVDQTARGILPKDLDRKLKRIEKLAKRLRSRISGDLRPDPTPTDSLHAVPPRKPRVLDVP